MALLPEYIGESESRAPIALAAPVIEEPEEDSYEQNKVKVASPFVLWSGFRNGVLGRSEISGRFITLVSRRLLYLPVSTIIQMKPANGRF